MAHQTLKPCHRIDRELERDFARELIRRNMALLIPEEDIPVGLDGSRLVGGWFAVDHTRGRLRLIFDRRLQNSTERTLTWPRLPSGCQLQHIVLESWETLEEAEKISNAASIAYSMNPNGIGKA